MTVSLCTTGKVALAVRFPRNGATAASSLGTSMSRFVSSVASDSAEAKKQPSVSIRTTTSDDADRVQSESKSTDQQPQRKKTQAELDKELQLKMQGISGDGGESGIEYEDGQPVSMKRSVRDNMFRYI
jgi:hypothetical protein